VAPPPPQQPEGGQGATQAGQATAGQNAAQPNQPGADDTEFLEAMKRQLGSL
jgi:hypothetical protein